jgi:hypothetical protein
MEVQDIHLVWVVPQPTPAEPIRRSSIVAEEIDPMLFKAFYQATLIDAGSRTMPGIEPNLHAASNLIKVRTRQLLNL